MENWLYASFDIIWQTVVSAIAILTIAVAVVRFYGLRSFAKMSSVDFATTIAFGTVLASVVMNTGQSLLKGGIAMITILAFQQLVSKLKRSSDWMENTLENNPTYLMWEGEILHDNMAGAEVTQADLMAKLREANVWNMQQVKAVVFETTGDVTVLHGDNWRDMDTDPRILEGIVPDQSDS